MNPISEDRVGTNQVLAIKSAFQRLLDLPWVIPFAIVLLGLWLRIFRINSEGVGYDEAFSLSLTQMPWDVMIGNIVQDFVHPPLHYFMLRAWLRLFGFGVLQARLLSAIFGTLSILMLYLLANYLFGRRTAVLSSLLLAVSQLGIMFSQEARPYAMFLFFFLCSCYLFLVALRKKRALPWWGFVCSSILMIYTHYWGVFVVLSLVLYAILYRKRYSLPISWWIGGAALALVLYAPWMTSGVVRQALTDRKTLPVQQGPWFAVHWWTFASAINSFNNGKTKGLLESSPLWTFLVGGLLFTAPLVLALKPLIPRPEAKPSERLEQESVTVVAILWILPMLLILGLGALNVQYNVRYVSFCAAPYYILVARGFSQLKSPWPRQALLVLVLAYSTYALRANYFLPWKENFRDAVAYVVREYKEGDCCTFLPFNNVVPRQWSLTLGSRLPGLKTTTPNALVSGSVSCKRVWVVVMTFGGNPWVQNQREAGEHRLEATHSKMEQRRYFWLDVDLYALKKK